MSKNKWYAVKVGQTPGLYQTWDEAKLQVDGYPKAVFKGFPTKEMAKSWFNGKPTSSKKATKRSNSKIASNTIPADFGNKIIIYTDGGCRNHGVHIGEHVKADDQAAFAYRITYDSKYSEKAKAEYGATNNKMELTAVVSALTDLKNIVAEFNRPIVIYTDSRYVLNGVNKHWIDGWKRNGWKKSNGSKLENKDLWKQLYYLLDMYSDINFCWIKGHADNPGNIRVDELVNEAMDQLE